MITGSQKPIDEIWGMIKDFKKVLVFGCNTCVAICHAGGEKEAETIASLLRMRASEEGKDIQIDHAGVMRHCEPEFFEPAGGSGTPVGKLVAEMNQYLDSLRISVPIVAPAETGTAPDTRFGCTPDAAGDCVEEGEVTQTNRELQLSVGRPSKEWITWLGGVQPQQGSGARHRLLGAHPKADVARETRSGRSAHRRAGWSRRTRDSHRRRRNACEADEHRPELDGSAVAHLR